MRILIANDDGYLAPGLQALVQACNGLGEIDVVAPEQNASGTSNSLTLNRPLSVFVAANGYRYINGTPSDCVHVALTGLLPQRPDLVLSGINNGANMGDDTLYSGTVAAAMEGFLFGIPAIAFSLIAQIGEQVDYLRFLPNRKSGNQAGWWGWLLATGPGWIFIGGFKLLVGSFLAVVALKYGIPVEQASQPTDMYYMAFERTFNSPSVALVLMGIFVIVCQLKINVTNAYAGSIAWSNFFSRLTHSHPGRVVWLVFNVLLALLLMEIGIFRAIESILVIYANFAAGWIGALTGDLAINKPLVTWICASIGG